MENYTIKLLVKETKWTSLEVRTHPAFLETLISKYDVTGAFEKRAANKDRTRVARAFPPRRFLNLILVHRGKVYIFNEARH